MHTYSPRMPISPTSEEIPVRLHKNGRAPVGGGPMREPIAVLRPRAHTASVARWATATAVLVSAVVHLYLWGQGMNQVAVIGPAFLVNGVGGVVLAIVVVAWRHWLPLLGAVGFGAATLGAFILSRTVGLFGVHETIWSTAAVISAVVEVLAIVFAIVAWGAERRRA